MSIHWEHPIRKAKVGFMKFVCILCKVRYRISTQKLQPFTKFHFREELFSPLSFTDLNLSKLSPQKINYYYCYYNNHYYNYTTTTDNNNNNNNNNNNDNNNNCNNLFKVDDVRSGCPIFQATRLMLKTLYKITNNRSTKTK